ncbi:MAG: pirin family protein [Prolixibacteraceae bacterium]|nr:pirin family protein [Prolixibacteraceae bacterium]
MKTNSIISIKPLSFMWPVTNPFLFCAHHLDDFPAGNDQMGPEKSLLKGRQIGSDFTIKDGWRMYHGETIPGFPAHPHRGFETVTVVTKGLVDHADSHGQAGRYGGGDVQWMTAGAGLQHSEMFPLLNQESRNPVELFQVWLNLPKSKKFVKPHFKMLWSDDIPLIRILDESGKLVEINVIAGSVGNVTALDPAPDSWAAEPENEVAIWTIKMEAGAQWKIAAASEQANRTLYFYRGSSIRIDGEEIPVEKAIQLKPNQESVIENGSTDGYFLLLQGRPINEPVVQYGPFVMNTQAEIQQAMHDYQRTEFGGWPWSRRDQVHPRDKGRFARHANGTEEIRSS